jgi:hypothetical protein
MSLSIIGESEWQRIFFHTSERLENLSFVLICTTSDNHLFLSSYVSIWFSLGSSLIMSMSNLGLHVPLHY